MILWLKSRGTRITCQTLQWGFDLFPEFARARGVWRGCFRLLGLSSCSLALPALAVCGDCLDQDNNCLALCQINFLHFLCLEDTCATAPLRGRNIGCSWKIFNKPANSWSHNTSKPLKQGLLLRLWGSLCFLFFCFLFLCLDEVLALGAS